MSSVLNNPRDPPSVAVRGLPASITSAEEEPAESDVKSIVKKSGPPKDEAYLRKHIEEVKRRLRDARDAENERLRDFTATVEALQHRLSSIEQKQEALQSPLQANRQFVALIQYDYDTFTGLFYERHELPTEDLLVRVRDVNAKVHELSEHIIQMFWDVPLLSMQPHDTVFEEHRIISGTLVSLLRDSQGAPREHANQLRRVIIQAVLVWCCQIHAESWCITNRAAHQMIQRLEEEMNDSVAFLRFWRAKTFAQIQAVEANGLEVCTSNIQEAISRAVNYCGWNFEKHAAENKHLQEPLTQKIQEIAQMCINLNQMVRRDQRADVKIGWCPAGLPFNSEFMETDAIGNPVPDGAQISCTTEVGVWVQRLNHPAIVMKAKVI